MNNSRFTGYNWPAQAFPSVVETAARSAIESVDYEQLFVSQLPLIERVTTQVCRRNHLRDAEAEDFASEVKLHLIERDYEVLRRFRRRSSIHTYLTVIVQRQFLNYRNREWGRWRPSAEATRLGAVAVLLERLIARDGLTFEEAQEQLRTNHRVPDDRSALYKLWIQLSPQSSARHFVSVDHANNVASTAPGPGANIGQAERDAVEKRVRVALDRAYRALAAEERLLIKMRYRDGFTVSQIAASLHMKVKPLYRTYDRLLARLKDQLSAGGISCDDVEVLLENTRFDRHPDASAEVVPFRNDQGREGTRG